MSESASLSPPGQRKLWVRVLLMFLMAIAFQIAVWALVIVALVQVVLVIASEGPHERLRAFGRGVGRYLAQIALFATFDSEELPFPFSDWPAAPV